MAEHRAMATTRWMASLAAVAIAAWCGRPGHAGETAAGIARGLARLPLAFVENRGQVDPRVADSLPGADAYQEVDGGLREVAVDSVLLSRGAGYEARFKLGPYDRARSLVIGPLVLRYCGYLGGRVGVDEAEAIAVDDAGNAYVTGHTGSDEASFPVTVGPDLAYNGGQYDVFVAKVEAVGTGLVYAGYIGGSGDEFGRGIAVDAAGSAYATGFTQSNEATFPVAVGPDLTFNGGLADAFVAKVRPDGAGLEHAGYVGGTGHESGWGIAVDAAGRAYVVGGTDSDELTFPVTVGPRLASGGGEDAFVARVKADGSGLDYAGYIGGDEIDVAYGVAVDGPGSAYVTGLTGSSATTFPVAVGPDLTHNGALDAFVAKVRFDGTRLEYAGYIGGRESESGLGIAIDAAGSAYVGGHAASDETTFPVTVGPDLTYNGGLNDAFAVKVKADGTGLDYAGYIGGDADDRASGIALDPAGRAYLTGFTASDETTFPVAGGPDVTFNGFDDAFVARVKADGSGLDHSGYVGGSGDDFGVSVAVDTAGSIYVTGRTTSDELSFPVTVGPDLVYDGVLDGFVAKIEVASCAQVAAPVQAVLAAKRIANRDDVDMVWQRDPAAAGYNLWYVTQKWDIDRARQATQPPAMGVGGCAAPVPAPGNACTDFGAVPRATPAVFFYQVRAACDAASEGP